MDNVAMIQGNVLIQGGQFVQHNTYQQHSHHCHEANDGFMHLQAHVSRNAYAIQQEGEAPKCHPNTRVAVISDILTWILLPVTRMQWIMWVYGAAGAGKSAIARSIVDLCIQKDIKIVRFFFFRSDTSRNTLGSVVATLTDQLIKIIPVLKSAIVGIMEREPLIFQDSLEAQLETLIFSPLRRLSAKLPRILFLIDGVDECNGDKAQATLLRTLIQFADSRTVPVIALFFSRAEPQINTVFRTSKVGQITQKLPLDNRYLPDNDIRRFLQEKFNEIRETHEFGHLLHDSWPSPAFIDEIVAKSSGQFIYASTVINFISEPRCHPASQLDIIRRIRAPGKLAPFAQLDALYCHLFASVENLSLTLMILAYFIFGITEYTVPTIESCCHVLSITKDDFHTSLVQLTSVLKISGDRLDFLHASLADFLMDSTRSHIYHIDQASYCTALCLLCLRKNDLTVIRGFLLHATGTEELREAIKECRPNWKELHPLIAYSFFLEGLELLVGSFMTINDEDVMNLIRQDLGDGGAAYDYHFSYYIRERDLFRDGAITVQGFDLDSLLADIEDEEEDETEPPPPGQDIDSLFIQQSALIPGTDRRGEEGASNAAYKREGGEERDSAWAVGTPASGPKPSKIARLAKGLSRLYKK